MKIVILLMALVTSLQSLAMDGHQNYLVFIGNPGVGKSSLINALVGKDIAHSGLSLSGITTKIQQIEHEGLILIDTPGLADIEFQEQASLEIEKSLKFSGLYRIFFVINIKSGRIIDKDCDTIIRVMKAINNFKKEFHIIINRIDEIEKEKIFENNSAYLRFVSILEGRLHLKPKSIRAIDLDIDLKNKTHHFIALRNEDRQFIIRDSEAFNLAPYEVGKIISEAAEKKEKEAELKRRELEEKRLRHEYEKAQRKKAQARWHWEEQNRRIILENTRLRREREEAESKAQALRDYEERRRLSELERVRLQHERNRLQRESEEARRKNDEAQRRLEDERRRNYESQSEGCHIL
jgi:GTP-binding protein EngB required for normal cell division